MGGGEKEKAKKIRPPEAYNPSQKQHYKNRLEGEIGIRSSRMIRSLRIQIRLEGEIGGSDTKSMNG